MYSNGALEAALDKVPAIIEPRAFAYRNRARMNRMLELVRLSQLRADNVGDYTVDIRSHLIAHDGHPPRTYQAIYDPTSRRRCRDRTEQPLVSYDTTGNARSSC